MPELPEIETLVLQLNRALEGRRISEVQIRHSSLLQNPRKEFQRQMVGERITRIGRRGKYIHIDLSHDRALWFHLGMTGQLFLEHPPESLKPHTHFIVSFFESKKKLFFRDVRRFGRIALTSRDEGKIPEGVRRLGLEPRQWDPQDLAAASKKRKTRIKSLLLDQRLVSGLGNIYADESLHRARIRPLTRTHRISAARAARLHQAMCEVLEEAIRLGGSSIDDYIHLDGSKGEFQNFHQVYGRAGKNCFGCGNLIRSVKISGRTSSFCPHCQQ